MARAAKVARSLHHQGLHRSGYAQWTAVAALCGRVRSDAWQRGRGLSTAQRSACAIRNPGMAADPAWHGLPSRLGKSARTAAPGAIAAARNAARATEPNLAACARCPAEPTG